MRVAVVLCAVLVLYSAPARADFAAGAEAYDGGDYATAFSEWLKDARAGQPAAQTALAGMYRSGKGRSADPARAARWYRRAADQGDAVAQLNLGEMYSQGQGVKRDAVRAYMWLSLAARQGNGWAAGAQEALARSMTVAEQRRAAALIVRWDRR